VYIVNIDFGQLFEGIDSLITRIQAVLEFFVYLYQTDEQGILAGTVLFAGAVILVSIGLGRAENLRNGVGSSLLPNQKIRESVQIVTAVFAILGGFGAGVYGIGQALNHLGSAYLAIGVILWTGLVLIGIGDAWLRKPSNGPSVITSTSQDGKEHWLIDSQGAHPVK
jgi:hypothetical protein